MTVRPRDALIKMEDVFTSRLQRVAGSQKRNPMHLHRVLGCHTEVRFI